MGIQELTGKGEKGKGKGYFATVIQPQKDGRRSVQFHDRLRCC